MRLDLEKNLEKKLLQNSKYEYQDQTGACEQQSPTRKAKSCSSTVFLMLFNYS